MANLTANKVWPTRDNGAQSARGAYQATNGVTFYGGSLVFLDMATGRAVKPADTATFVFKGLAMKQVTGDTAASPIPEVEVNEAGVTIEKVTVTGVSAITHVGDRVYIATTDNAADFTLTATTNTGPIGVITRWYSGTTCDVQLMTPNQYLAQEDKA